MSSSTKAVFVGTSSIEQASLNQSKEIVCVCELETMGRRRLNGIGAQYLQEKLRPISFDRLRSIGSSNCGRRHTCLNIAVRRRRK